MTLIHKLIIDNADIINEEFRDVWEETVQSPIKYSIIRAEWNLLTKEQKLDKDPLRTSLHDTLILNFVLLERIFKINQWIDKLWTENLFLQGEVSMKKKLI